MSIFDFVCYVLRVPANLDGFVYTCKAIRYVIDNGGDSGFYERLSEEFEKNYSCIEKALRLAKTKAVARMSKEDYLSIFQGEEDIKVKEFICYAAQYYRKEFMEDED